MVAIEDLVDVVRRVNEQRESPVDSQLLEQVIALVDKNPLDDDRARCQQQIMKLIQDRTGA